MYKWECTKFYRGNSGIYLMKPPVFNYRLPNGCQSKISNYGYKIELKPQHRFIAIKVKKKMQYNYHELQCIVAFCVMLRNSYEDNQEI